MTSPLPLPDWVPWWIHLGILLVLLFIALMFLLMPFSVFGTRARLEAIDARLDEIQGEIRSLSLRLPEPSLPETDDELPSVRRPGPRPPIPPAPYPSPRREAASPARKEPRLF